MFKLRRIITLLMWPMAFLLPLWLTFGRALFGSSGWLTLVFLISTAPMLLGVLIAINVIIHFNSTYKLEHLVTKPQAIILFLLYCSIFLFSLFVLDGGDTPESVSSIATRILGRGFEDTSMFISGIFYGASMVLVLAAFVMAIGGRFTWIRSWKVWAVIILSILATGEAVIAKSIQHNNDPKVRDKQISYDFQLMKQDIWELKDQKGSLPSGSAKQIAGIGRYGKQYHIAKRAGKYMYIPLPEQRLFKLCAIFATDTMGNYPATADGSENEGFHHAGYQCITYNAL